MLEASGEGKALAGEERSTTVILEEAKAGRRVRARAVERPKTPEPMMRIVPGGLVNGGFEAMMGK